MDKNKLAKLREINYTIAPCCYLCKHSHFPNVHVEWGTCTKHEFAFPPVAGGIKQISVIKFGRCGDFEVAEGIEAGLAAYTEFFREKP